MLLQRLLNVSCSVVLGIFWGAFTTGRYISQREKNVMYCQSTEETLGQGEGKSARQ